MTAYHRGGKERRSVPNKKEMRRFPGRNIGARLDREGFEPLTKLRRWLFPRHGAITPLMDLHATINRNEAGIGIEAKREEETNKEKCEQFGEGSHNN